MSNSKSKFKVSGLIGLIFGVLIGILLAPKSGKETRQTIKNSSNQLIIKSERFLKQAYYNLTKIEAELNSNIEKFNGPLKSEVNEFLKSSQSTITALKSLLSAIREGQFNNQEYQKVVYEYEEIVKRYDDLESNRHEQ